MKRSAASIVFLAFAIFPHHATSQPIPVARELADMVEQVVVATGISVNISEQTRTSVNINKVNGVNVCVPEARADVEKLQSAFDAHANIYQNFGPAFASVVQSDGTKKRLSLADLQAQGAIEGCPNIYVSIRD